MGNVPPMNLTWDYEQHSPPFPPFYVPLIAVFIYGITLYSIVQYMKKREGFKLKWLFFLHNVILCLISVILFCGLSFEVIRTWYYFGIRAAYCGTGDDEWDQKLLKWAIWFYLSKFYELFDTIFLAVRKRPLTFLHVFHHVLVATACWLEIQSEMYFGWITGVNNAFVHIVMYYYFASQCVNPREVWWKKYITVGQILQFVIDMTTSYPWLYFYLTGATCRGDPVAWVIANLGGAALTVLFLNFYYHSYIKKRPAGAHGAHQHVKKD
jgi:fatty acid elongase 3